MHNDKHANGIKRKDKNKLNENLFLLRFAFTFLFAVAFFVAVCTDLKEEALCCRKRTTTKMQAKKIDVV